MFISDQNRMQGRAIKFFVSLGKSNRLKNESKIYFYVSQKKK